MVDHCMADIGVHLRFCAWNVSLNVSQRMFWPLVVDAAPIGRISTPSRSVVIRQKDIIYQVAGNMEEASEIIIGEPMAKGLVSFSQHVQPRAARSKGRRMSGTGGTHKIDQC